MSDPATDIHNMIDHPGFDPAIIPSHLVILEDPVTYNEQPGAPLDPNDFSQAEKLNDQEVQFDDSGSEDPTMMANLFQGDIRISSNDQLFQLTAHASFDPRDFASSRNAIIEEEKKWKQGVIPYEISKSYNNKERVHIAKGIAKIHQNTCIRFVPRSNDKDYIFIKKGSGCSSAVGRVGGMQSVSLGTGCIYTGIIIHELLHAIGLWHEQSRADRDSFVKIHYDNIRAGMEYNFQKYDWNIIQNLGITYDTGSIMHYGENAFAIDRKKPTISSFKNDKLGQRDGMSPKDTDKIRRLYKCQGTSVVPVITKPKPAPPIPVPDMCVDNNEFCSYWAEHGECKTNVVWMNLNCKKSCGQCGKCSDGSKTCEKWAKNGECYKQSSYMMYHCRKSCKLCEATGGGNVVDKCKDNNKYCSQWASSGECRANPRYMKKECRKSCRVC